MDRGTRCIQKARICARLRQVLAEEIQKHRLWTFHWNARPLTDECICEMRRRVYRNEGKRYNPRFTYTYHRCDCNICEDNRRYRTLREAERMAQDARQWRLFGSGEGEEGD